MQIRTVPTRRFYLFICFFFVSSFSSLIAHDRFLPAATRNEIMRNRWPNRRGYMRTASEYVNRWRKYEKYECYRKHLKNVLSKHRVRCPLLENYTSFTFEAVSCFRNKNIERSPVQTSNECINSKSYGLFVRFIKITCNILIFQSLYCDGTKYKHTYYSNFLIE
jgi:hypothetical protein